MTNDVYCAKIATVIKMENDTCSSCPRKCHAIRTDTEGFGICRTGILPILAKATVHMWEEPCISGERGSGAIFFSGCSLKCIYCQNRKISSEMFGKSVSIPRLREIFSELIQLGVHNINLVNPTHFAHSLLIALQHKPCVPVVYNTSGYETIQTLRQFEGKIQIYLPDLKYDLCDVAKKYSAAPNYPEIAKSAILEMFRQTGPYIKGDDGVLQSGVIIRHLILPGNLENTRRVVDWVSDTFAPGDILFSLMSQYTPCVSDDYHTELNRRITKDEYAEAMEWVNQSSIADGFFQELSSAESEYIPDFDLKGV